MFGIDSSELAAMSAASTGQDVARRLIDAGYVVVIGMLTPPGAQAARTLT